MIRAWLKQQTLNLKSDNVLVYLGLVIGLCYFPIWLKFYLIQITTNSSGGFTLTTCFVITGGMQLWRQRHCLELLQALEVDHWLGNSLIIVGIFLFPFCRFSLWSQSLVWLLILVGIAISHWGLSFLHQYPGIVFMVTFSVYPNPGHIAATLWQTLLPAQILESAMAWATTIALQCFGQTVVVSDSLIIFPYHNHNIEIGWGCNGFDMALAMIGAGLLLGLYLRLSFHKIVQLICIGTVLALVFNIPRLTLMSLAAIYWGDNVFDFLHGSWGGQIFVVAILLSYYDFVLRMMLVDN